MLGDEEVEEVREARAPTSKRARLGYRPELDGLRAIAIALVVWHHSLVTLVGSPWVHVLGGYLGVDVFFVLSGFLITTLLIERRDDPERARLGAFYRRRAARLLPVLVVFLTAHLVAVVVAGGGLRTELRTIAAALTYTSNWAATFEWRLAVDQPHLWSLAVEEQYYIVWPIALGLLARQRTRVALGLVAASAVGVALWRAYLLHRYGGDQTLVYQRTDTRFDALLVGSALAIALAMGWRPARRAALAMAAVGATVVVWFVAFSNPFGDVLFNGGFTVVAVGVAAVILGVLEPDALPARLLSWRPLVVIGRLSYSLYVWHIFAFLLVVRVFREPTFPRFVLALAAALAMSWFSYHGVERPLLQRWGTARGARPQRVKPPERSPIPFALRLTGAGGIAMAALMLVGVGAGATVVARLRDASPDRASVGPAVPAEAPASGETQLLVLAPELGEPGASAPVRVAAVLGRDGVAIADQRITFDVGAGGATCEAVTDATGMVSCTVEVAVDPTAQVAVVATFAGGSGLAATTATWPPG